MNSPHSKLLRQVPWLSLLASFASCAGPTVAPREAAPPRPEVRYPLLGAFAAQEASALVAREPAAAANSTLRQAAAPPPPEQAKPWLPGLSGWSKTRYRFRTVDGDSDHDLYEVFALDYAEPEERLTRAHFLGRAALDLDGGSGSQLSSINDTQDGSLDADVYEAYVEHDFLQGDLGVRVGRASEYLTPEIAHYDGAKVEARAGGKDGLEFGAYGGRNVVFDSANDDDGTVFGAFAQGRPWRGGRARLDWMHLEDEALLGDDEDDLVGLGLWQHWTSWAVSGAYTRVEDRDRDVELRTRWTDDTGRTAVNLRYFELLETQNQRALFLDPYLQALQTYFPYRQFGANAFRAITEKLDLDVGFDVREVDDSDDVGTYNHDWRRYFAALTLREFIARPWTVQLNADYYDDDQSDVSAYGGSVTRALPKGLEATLGSYYSLYKYDLFSASERDDVQTYFAKLVWRQSKSWTFDLLYEYEDDDLDEYHTLRCGALCRF